MIFSMAGVIAQQNKFMTSNVYSESEMKQIQNRFENKYMFNCTGECFYMDGGVNQNFENNIRLEVRTQKRFLGLFNVEALDVYYMTEDGEIGSKTHNIWSRLLNRERIRI